MNDELIEEIRGLLVMIADVDLTDPTCAQSMIEARASHGGSKVARVRELLLASIEAGGVLDREHAGIRFGRLSTDIEGFSVDVVLSSGPGPRHMHPEGEIDLLFARAGSPKFDGHAEGWAVYAPGSTHVPEVCDGEMLILYFLPGGKVEWC